MVVVDLTQPLLSGGPVYPGDTATLITPCKTVRADGYALCKLETGLHAATHVDMPMHLIDDGGTAADFAPGLFVGEGVMIDGRGTGVVEMRPGYERLINEGDIVLIETGHDVFYGGSDYYTGYPAISDELAAFLVRRRIKMLGVDAPSPDYAPFPVHRILLGGGVFILENLTNLSSLHGAGSFTVVAAPIKIAAEAGLVRAIGILRKE